MCTHRKQKALSLMGGIRIPRARLAWWLLAASLAGASVWAAVAPKAGETNHPSVPASANQKPPGADTPVSGPIPAPKAAPARRNEWAPVFRKPAPTSIADLKSIEQHVKTLVRRVSSAVVAVEVGYGSGSGVVISPDGFVLTAGHVCGRPGRSVRFTFPDGKLVHGKTLGLDLDSDTGLMRITDPGTWPYAAMGDLEDANIGDWVLALGHPGGFDVSRSLVVRLGRVIELADDALQTDCTISPGDSGGPLFDMEGRVIGIHSAISTSPAENFHVAITEYYGMWDELARGSRVTEFVVHPRAYVGASGVDDSSGCRLTSIEKNSPAFKAGLKLGDVVLKVEDRDVMVSAAFRRWVAEAEPGETLHLQVKRGKEVLDVPVKVEAPPGLHNSRTP
jgi:serine protease Do